jgi:hypothetical protein
MATHLRLFDNMAIQVLTYYHSFTEFRTIWLGNLVSIRHALFLNNFVLRNLNNKLVNLKSKQCDDLTCIVLSA